MEQREQESLFAVEMQVHRPFRDTHPLGDLVNRHLVVPPLQEQLLRGAQNQPLTFLALPLLERERR